MNKDLSIIAQSSYKTAAEFLNGRPGSFEDLAATARAIFNDVVALGEDTRTEPVQYETQQAVPQAPQDVYAQAEQNLQQGGIQVTHSGAGISEHSKEWELWNDLLANPDDWWNNTGDGGTTISGGNKPDFKHKHLKKGDWPIGLFLVSKKYGKTAPDEVFAKFGLQKPAMWAVPGGRPASPVPGSDDDQF